MTPGLKHALTDHTAKVDRIASFSDGCFAIIITLLVIEIRVPHAEPGQLKDALLAAWPSYAAFALAFIYVGVIWLNHQGILRRIERTDPGLSWLNLGILGTAALMPFPTGVLAEALQVGNPADMRSAVVLYAVVAAFMSAAWVPMFPYLERHRERLAPGVWPGYFSAQYARPWIGLVLYVAAIFAALAISPWAAVGIFVLAVAYHALTSDGRWCSGVRSREVRS
jgi:uncharacterized membrane protein